MKKLIKITNLMILSILYFSCFYGCAKSGTIPNGCYIYPDGFIAEGYYVLYEEDSNPRISFCWEIDGNKAQRWTSGMVTYRAKIVEKNDRIYFEGYVAKNYEVIYDEALKSITLICLKVGE